MRTAQCTDREAPRSKLAIRSVASLAAPVGAELALSGSNPCTMDPVEQVSKNKGERSFGSDTCPRVSKGIRR
jgi:hypothetical protein